MRLSADDFVYRDDVVVVLNKPSGLAVHRGAANDRVTALTEVRNTIGQWVYPVHRLDRGTSGLVLFVLDRHWVAPIQEQFVSNVVFKRYVALVRGIPDERGIIDHPIPRTQGGPRVPAKTRYELRESFERYAWLSLQPLSGRMHQLRRHLKHISHPIVGDVKYGDGRVNREFRARFDLHRLALHAAELRFEHPADGAIVEARAPLPEDLRRPLTQMGLAALT
ncbi:MAG: pseudouridine synthase [Myxococcota bacterium]